MNAASNVVSFFTRRTDADRPLDVERERRRIRSRRQTVLDLRAVDCQTAASANRRVQEHDSELEALQIEELLLDVPR